MLISKIISGGQTGVDRGAIEAVCLVIRFKDIQYYSLYDQV